MAENTINLLKNQDCTAIAQLYDTYGRVLYGVVLRIVPSKKLAQQVIQDTFLKAWRYGSTYDESKGRLFTWLVNIARDTAIDATRTYHFHNGQITENTDVQFKPLGNDHLNPDTISLKEAMNKLDEKNQQVIDLIYFKGYSHNAVAEEIGAPMGTIKTQVRYAISELKKTFV